MEDGFPNRLVERDGLQNRPPENRERKAAGEV